MPRYFRRIIKIRAVDSPNVKLALAQIRAGEEPTGEVLIPGVLPWHDYQKRMATWDEVKICIGLNAEFWEGADALLYPPTWIDRANALAANLRGKARQSKAIGIDPAEGGDETSMCAVDEYGIVQLASHKTPNTTVIANEAIAFMRDHKVPSERTIFDAGGGGKIHADILRSRGYPVKIVSFGGAPTAEYNRSKKQLKAASEDRITYEDRRAEMYGTLRILIDPGESPLHPAPGTVHTPGHGFAIPAEYERLRKEMAPIPLVYGQDGKLHIPPKRKKTKQGEKTGEKTLLTLIGWSPDHLDSLVLALSGLLHKVTRPRAGKLF